MPHRLLALLTVAGLALCAATATSAPAAGVPTVVRGQALHIKMTTPSFAVCAPIVQYSDGTTQTGALKKANDGHLSWSLLVPRSAPLGAGSWYVRCGIAVERRGRFTVSAGKSAAGNGDAPRVVIDKQGYSQRNDKYGTGSTFSFGMFLRNTSDAQDAMNVYVLVNMVASNGELVGSVTRTIGLIAATQTFAFGDSMPLRAQAPVAKLEVTIRIGSHQVKEAHNLPEFANVRIVPNQFDTGWVGEVDGEVLNSVTGSTLMSARLSIVLLDAAGNPVGGGTGNTLSPLPSGSRMVFLATSGFSAVPLDRALTPVVSAEPTYAAG